MEIPQNTAYPILLIKKLNEISQIYETVRDKDLLFVSLSTNKDNIYMFEANFSPRYFQHLCGIKSGTKSSISFYKSCFDGTVKIEDCTPSRQHNYSDVVDKINSLSTLLTMKNMKMQRLGKKMNGIGNIDFDFAVGNESFLGYKYDSAIKKYYPLSNMIAPIGSYCTNPNKISLILSKNIDRDKYDTIEYEVSKNLISKLDDDVKNALASFIDDDLLSNELDVEKSKADIEQE